MCNQLYSLFTHFKMEGKYVLELGSGCGLAGLTLMLKGCRVTFTDLSNVVDELTHENVLSTYRKFSTSPSLCLYKPDVHVLDWFEFSKNSNSSIRADTYAFLRNTYDYILLTDCIFSMEATDYLIDTILKCSDSKTTIIISYEIRDMDTNSYFLTQIQLYFSIKKIPENQFHQNYMNKLVQILFAKRNRKH